MGWIIGKGIGVPFRMGGSQNWSTYWASLISAVVEDAAPNDFVLTFAAGKPTLDETDFTIAGFPLTNAVWSGAVLTLTSSTFVAFCDTPVVTFIPSGGTANVTNNVVIEAELTTYMTGLTTPLSTTYQATLDRIIKNLKTGLSITNLSDFFDVILALGLDGGTEESSLKNLVKDDHHATKAGTPLYIPNKGWLTDNSTDNYIETNYNPSTDTDNYTRDNAAIGIYSRRNFKDDGSDTEVAAGVGGSKMVLRDASGNFIGRVNASYIGVNGVTEAVADRLGMFIVSRWGSSVANQIGYKDKTSLTSVTGTAATLALVNATFNVGRLVPGLTAFYFLSAHVSTAARDIIIDAVKPHLDSSIVWEMQGTVLSKLDGTDDQNNVFEPVVIFEGNAQVIETGASIFKMWYTQGWGTSDICYAESLDGVTWVNYASNPIIEDHCRPCVIKVGGTYYCYAHEMTTNTKIDLYTSADGINFTLHTANVLVPGAPGAWDDLAIHNTTVLIEDGTWYLFYDGIKTGAGETFHIGLATSPDGVTWTKYASNPVIGGTTNRGSSDVHKIGDSYYLWCLGTPAGTLPTDLYRYKSVDLLTWVQDTVHETFVRATDDEGCGLAVGQVADPDLIEISGQVYMFYVGTPNGSLSSGHMHIKLAIADMSFSDLVLTDETNL